MAKNLKEAVEARIDLTDYIKLCWAACDLGVDVEAVTDEKGGIRAIRLRAWEVSQKKEDGQLFQEDLTTFAHALRMAIHQATEPAEV